MANSKNCKRLSLGFKYWLLLINRGSIFYLFKDLFEKE